MQYINAVERRRSSVTMYPAIPEDAEWNNQFDPIEDTIQKQYVETKSMMNCKNDNNAEKKVSKHALEILFKFNNHATVEGHSEEEILRKHNLLRRKPKKANKY
jgi:hypothetical protein